MKRKIAALISILLLLIHPSSLEAYAVSYEQKVSIANNMVAIVKVIVQDKNMWAQSSFSGMETIVIRNPTGAYSYLPSVKTATKIPAEMDRPNLTTDLPNFLDFLKKNGGTKIGSEQAGGKNTDVYKFTEPTLQKEAKVWVWTEKNFPVKIEVPAPDGVTLVELYNIQFEPPIASGQFELPADTKIVDLQAVPTEPAAGSNP